MSDYPPYDPDADFSDEPADGLAPDGATPDGPAFDPAPFERDDYDVMPPTFDASSFDTSSFDTSSFETHEAPAGDVPTFDAAPFDAAPFDAAPFDAEAFDQAPAFDTLSFSPIDTMGGDETAAVAMPGLSDADQFFGVGGAAMSYAPVAEPPPLAQPASPLPDGPSGDGAAPVATPTKARKSASRSKEALVLGLHITGQRVYGVLVRQTSDGYEPLRQFVRNRLAGGDPNDTQALTPDALGADDFAGGFDGSAAGVQFGGAPEIDFAAEFAGIADAPEIGLGGMEGVVPAGRVQPVVFEIKDILEECQQAGFPRPALAFTVGQPDVDYLEMTVPVERKARAAKPEKAVKGKPSKKGAEPTPDASAGIGGDKPDKLVALLQKEVPTADKTRVGFLPMTPRGGHRRYLAVYPTASEPVVPSVEMLREQSAHRKATFRTLQAEVPLLVGLARLTTPAEAAENTALVRVGAEDTLVLLITGGVLHHMELMQSVTAFDGPDTICSRVLLQQDVQGVGTVHNVVVMAEEREAELVQGFAAFYPEARVETLREGVARMGLVGPYGPLAPSLVEAAGAAIAGTQRRGPFDAVNLLPPSLRKNAARLDLTFSWHTVVVAALLFLSVLFFVYLYVAQQNELAAAQQQLAEYPPEARMSAPQLQARIDSLRLRQADLTHNMAVLDSLLYGTDRWTQALLGTTRAAASTGGIWIEEWTPSGDEIGIMGFATARGQVVRLAERLEATIEEVSFKEIRERSVYQYRMRFASPPQLPQTARVVREQMGEPLPAPPAEPLAGLDGAPPPPPPAPAPPPAEAPAPATP